MKKIQILLSTYNGEKYLREQLDSFAALDNFEDVKVLIRDDGSSDSTKEILLEYKEKYGFEVILGENVGVNMSFHQLILRADRGCEYFAFSDQDDIWLPHKISAALRALSEMDMQKSALYSATSTLVGDDMSVYGHTLIPKKKLSFYNAMVQNVAVGHTQVFNRYLLELLAKEFSQDISITDHWAYLLASATGQVVHDEAQTTLYRQHENNLIGYRSSFFATFKNRLKRAMSGAPQEKTRQLEAFLICYGDVMVPEYRKELTRFLASQKNVFKRLAYVLQRKVYRQTFIETLIFCGMYFLGKYKIKTKNRFGGRKQL